MMTRHSELKMLTEHLRHTGLALRPKLCHTHPDVSGDVAGSPGAFWAAPLLQRPNESSTGLHASARKTKIDEILKYLSFDQISWQYPIILADWGHISVTKTSRWLIHYRLPMWFLKGPGPISSKNATFRTAFPALMCSTTGPRSVGTSREAAVRMGSHWNQGIQLELNGST